MDQARATAQANRQQPTTKHRAIGAPKKGGLKKAARTPGVRKLGQSPKAQQMPAEQPAPQAAAPANVVPFGRPRRSAPQSAMAAKPPAPRPSSRPVGERASQPLRGRGPQPLGARAPQPAGARHSQPFAATVPARAGRGGREVFRFDEDQERAAEQAQAAADGSADPATAPRRRGFVGRLTERFGAKRQAAAKTRAARSFDRQYGGQSAPAPGDSAGPRAAVYQGQMGAKHRQAARSLASGALGAASAASSAAKGGRKQGHHEGRFSMKAVVPAVVAACLVATCVFMYGPVQLWYQQMRENDRLQLEYAALVERNGALQDDVDSLSSEAGVEDRVHQQYGWVREDEHAVSVSGLSSTSDIDFIANVSPGSVTAPETWYSGFLDPLFGVS